MSKDSSCLIIGASHAGVNCAFALRRQGWEGKIILFDADPHLPYHRPPLSKAFLSDEEEIEKHLLRPQTTYEKNAIELRLDCRVAKILPATKQIQLVDDSYESYDKLVLATGASALIPKIPGIKPNPLIYTLRNLADALAIKKAFQDSVEKRVMIVGGGYIGLEVAASLKKLGGRITVLEREKRVLARVTAPEVSEFFEKLHANYGVKIFTDKEVTEIRLENDRATVLCSDQAAYQADLIVLGVGIKVNQELASDAGLEITEKGIRVDQTTRTNSPHIYAIGDCTDHYNSYYQRFVRLESVQNAVDQSKVAAAAICGREVQYHALPWFWSDQYDIKFQSVGLASGYDQRILRIEKEDENKRSVWYFKDDQLLAVDAINHPKAYVLGTKFIKGGETIDRSKLSDAQQDLTPANLLVSD